MQKLTFLMLLLLTCFASYAQEVPFLSHDSFEFEMDYGFKTKPPPDRDRVSLVEDVAYSADLLPYVKVAFSFTDLPEETFRILVVDNKGNLLRNRKHKTGRNLELDLGFSDDIKDQIIAYGYTIYLVSKSKDKLARISMLFEESGDFYLNEDLYGKI